MTQVTTPSGAVVEDTTGALVTPPLTAPSVPAPAAAPALPAAPVQPAAPVAPTAPVAPVAPPAQPTAPAAPVTPATPEPKVYNVNPGDTVSSIAQKFGVHPSEVSGYRSGDPNKIFPGESLTIGNAAPAAPVAPAAPAAPKSPTAPYDPTPDLQHFFQSVFGQNGDALQYGFNTNPTKTVKDLVTEVMQSTGLPDISANVNSISSEIETLQNRQADEVAAINDNPFLSAGSKKERIDALDTKYSQRIDSRTNRLKLLQSSYDDARQQAQFAATTAINLFDKNQNFDEKKLEFVMNEAQKYLDAQNKSTNDTQVVDAGGRKVLIDSKTGKTIKDLGTSSSSGTGTVHSGGLTYTGEDYGADSKTLEQSRGADGWVDPAIYQRLYSRWVSLEGSTKDFLAKFPPKIYVNPANDTLPPILRSSTTSLDSQINNLF